jgi:transcriptional regulator with XRE-family HTH domain
LGDAAADDEIDDDLLAWQEWTAKVIEELRIAGASFGMPSWENVPSGLDLCRKIIGGSKQLAQMVNVPEVSLSRWVKGRNMPSFESLLKLCYVLDISPQQLIMSDLSKLEEVMKTKMSYRPPRPRKPAPLPKNQENTLQLIQAILDGREDPLSVPQIERYLGLSRNTIVYHYPEKAVLVTAQYRAYRKEQARQLLKRKCDEVRVATFSLHAQGVFPSQGRVCALLSDPNWMIMPEAKAAWHAARFELGLEG